MDRRAFAAHIAAFGVASPLFPDLVFARAVEGPITAQTLKEAESLAGITLTDAQRERMVDDLQQAREGFDAIRAMNLPNSVAPSVRFDPFTPAGLTPRTGTARARVTPPRVAKPASDTDLAFLGVAGLAHLVRTRQVTSTRLTELFLSRLREYDPVLKCVVSFTEARAREAAARADREIAAGRYRGPLHGIPYGAKDLLSARGYPTTWGTPPFADQTLDVDAEVVRKLDAAGAVLVAKLSLGELAWGDVWTVGRTNNPWNVEVGSSGSSAGSASAVSAGLVPFAIGSETLGSIVSPSTRCGVTGHRPTFGAVSRAGAMALSWTMDKLGPICRSALDCALVFNAIRGTDPAGAPDKDAAARDVPFPFNPASPLRTLKVGYLASAFARDGRTKAADNAALDAIRGLGVTPRSVELPDGYPLDIMVDMLSVEGAAAFEALAHDGGFDRMVRQTEDSWPHVLRAARFYPAVDYVQMARARTRLMQDTARAFGDLDVIVAPSFAPRLLAITNLTGHPCVVVPHAFFDVEGHPERKAPASFSFIGGLDRDAEALHLAHAFQTATDHHRRRPPVGA
jgi:Asp-tRNA(Asn)/Glu-tRNA(Gln) amidotransferase A subunit family amidase